MHNFFLLYNVYVWECEGKIEERGHAGCEGISETHPSLCFSVYRVWYLFKLGFKTSELISSEFSEASSQAWSKLGVCLAQTCNLLVGLKLSWMITDWSLAKNTFSYAYKLPDSFFCKHILARPCFYWTFLEKSRYKWLKLMKIKLYMCTSVLEKNSTYSRYLYGSVFRLFFIFL